MKLVKFIIYMAPSKKPQLRRAAGQGEIGLVLRLGRFGVKLAFGGK